MNFNKLFLCGNLCRDPSMTYLPSNMPIVEWGMAVNRRFKKQDGSQGEEVLFVDCQAFGKTAEVINEHFHKGDPIFVEGRLKLDQWQDKEGNKRSKHRVTVENFQFVTSKKNGQQPDDGEAWPRRSFKANDAKAVMRPPIETDEVDLSEVPF